MKYKNLMISAEGSFEQFILFVHHSILIPRSQLVIKGDVTIEKSFKWKMLIQFTLMFYFYTPIKLQKTRGFLVFSVGIEMDH